MFAKITRRVLISILAAIALWCILAIGVMVFQHFGGSFGATVFLLVYAGATALGMGLACGQSLNAHAQGKAPDRRDKWEVSFVLRSLILAFLPESVPLRIGMIAWFMIVSTLSVYLLIWLERRWSRAISLGISPIVADFEYK